MTNNGPTGSVSGMSLDILHKIFTVVLAVATTVLGIWQFQLQHKLDVEQAKLKQKVERTTLVDKMLKRIESYMDKQSASIEGSKGLTEREKTQILISLLKIAAEIHLEQPGEAAKRIKEIPLHFALLSDNDEMLVNIGSTPEALDLWVPLARVAGDVDVKATAAKALEKIATLTTDGNVQALIITYLLDLAADWQDSDLNNPLAEALRNVLQRIDGEDLKEIPELADAFYQAQVKFELLEIPTEIFLTTEGEADKAMPKIVKPEIIKQVNLVFEKVQVRQESDPEIKELIKTLEDDDKKIRRSARSKLGNVGERAVSDLLGALEMKGTVYRVRLGVITAFLLMEQPVQIQNDKIHLVTDLLGDSDNTVRKNTANFLIANLQALGQIKDPQSEQAIKSIVEALSTNLSNHDNTNGVYNSVVVLGEVRKHVSESFASIIKEQLIKVKEELAKNPRAWQKTISLLERYLN